MSGDLFAATPTASSTTAAGRRPPKVGGIWVAPQEIEQFAGARRRGRVRGRLRGGRACRSRGRSSSLRDGANGARRLQADVKATLSPQPALRDVRFGVELSRGPGSGKVDWRALREVPREPPRRRDRRHAGSAPRSCRGFTPRATTSSRSGAGATSPTRPPPPRCSRGRAGRRPRQQRGRGASAPLSAPTLADWREQLDVNATGAFLCTRAALPGMPSAAAGGSSPSPDRPASWAPK
jgi:hypothetical protein